MTEEDKEEIRGMLSTRGWKVLTQQIDESIDSLRARLETCKPDTLSECQARIAALRWLKNRPRELTEVSNGRQGNEG